MTPVLRYNLEEEREKEGESNINEMGKIYIEKKRNEKKTGLICF